MAGKAIEVPEIKIIVGQAWDRWVGWWQGRWLCVGQRRQQRLKSASVQLFWFVSWDFVCSKLFFLI